MDSKEPMETGIEARAADLRDKNGMTRKQARDHLVRLGSQATPYLLPLLSEHDSQTRWEAAKALSDIADPASIPALVGALRDEEDDVSWLAAQALAAIGPPATAALLQALVEGVGIVKVRDGVHHALRELRESEVGDKIADVYAALNSSHADVEIIAAAKRALRSLNS